MDLLIVRHGIALDLHELPINKRQDKNRPLSEQGIEKMQQNAKFFSSAFPKNKHIFCSDLLRAQQTADIIAKHFSGVPIKVLKHLSPECDPYETIQELGKHLEHSEENAILVSHMPLVSRLMSLLTTGNETEIMNFKKGGAANLEIRSWTPGGASLRWAVSPKLIYDVS